MTFVYICIPVHDEEQTIGPLLWKVRRVMAEYGRDYHIVVADDASTDGTAEVLASYAGLLPLTVVRCAERRGYGPTLERALRKAANLSRYPKRDSIVTLQGDFTDDPSLIPELVRHIEGGADIVGNTGAEELTGAPWARRVVRAAFDRLGRRAGADAEAGRMGAGFRAYRAIVPRKVFEDLGAEPLLRSDGWSADAELLRAMLPQARRVASGNAPAVYGRRQRDSRFDWREGVRQVRAALSGGGVPVGFPLESPLEDLAREAPTPRRSRRRAAASSRKEGAASRRSNGRGGRGGRDSARRRPSAKPSDSGSGGEPSEGKSGTSKRRRRRRRRGGSSRRSPGADST